MKIKGNRRNVVESMIGLHGGRMEQINNCLVATFNNADDKYNFIQSWAELACKTMRIIKCAHGLKLRVVMT